MPENRIEWAVFGVGLVVLAALGVLIGLNLANDPAPGTSATAASPARETQTAQQPPAAPLAPPAAAATTAAARTTALAPVRATPKPPRAPARATPKPARKARTAAPAGVRLQLTATRGDSWLEVRSGSSAGTVLFSGTLARGTTRTFRAGRLWVRFGGASNLDARLNGRPLGLRFGTYDTFVTTKGLAPAG